MDLTFLSTSQIFPNKTLEMIKRCVDIRDAILNRILKKHKVGDGEDESMSEVARDSGAYL